MTVLKRINSTIDKKFKLFKNKIISEFPNNKDLHDFMNIQINTCAISPDDIVKSSRVKNIIPSQDRCEARKSNCDRCSRRKKETFNFCGTHIKGTPHGVINDISPTVTKVQFKETYINGILYYVDSENVIYHHYDIMNKISNPRVIGCVVDGNIFYNNTL